MNIFISKKETAIVELSHLPGDKQSENQESSLNRTSCFLRTLCLLAEVTYCLPRCFSLKEPIFCFQEYICPLGSSVCLSVSSVWYIYPQAPGQEV